MENDNIDWKRITAFLRQEMRGDSKTDRTIETTIASLQAIAAACGKFSQNRRMLQRIGRLMMREGLTIIIPVCPDYTHEAGKYTFQSLNGGVSLITRLHIAFLQAVMNAIPYKKIIFLIADHEADDTVLCRCVRKTRSEFVSNIESSLSATVKAVESYGWEVDLMTRFVPDLISLEKEVAEWIGSNPAFQSRIDSETIMRSDMYHKIMRSAGPDEMRKRTIITAAQYVALGRFAASQGHLICNHTTTNLAWYLQADTAVLHNPVSIY